MFTALSGKSSHSTRACLTATEARVPWLILPIPLPRLHVHGADVWKAGGRNSGVGILWCALAVAMPSPWGVLPSGNCAKCRLNPFV